MTYWGWDYAWWRPSASTLKSNGCQFVCRYLSYDTTGKNLTKAEATFLKANGVDIVSNWEYATKAALSGYHQGVEDAKAALAQHNAAGGPSKAPIYFSCDWDATPSQQTAVDNYLAGCASVIGKSRVGVYGSYYLVERCRKSGSAAWFWQTYAWSGPNVSGYAHLLQYNNGVQGGQADQDKSLKDNFGQWSKNGAAPTPEKDIVLAVTSAQQSDFDKLMDGYRVPKYTENAKGDLVVDGEVSLPSALGLLRGAQWVAQDDRNKMFARLDSMETAIAAVAAPSVDASAIQIDYDKLASALAKHFKVEA